MRARWTMQCSCGCRERIYTGSSFVSRNGRPYKSAHLVKVIRDKQF